MICVIKPKLKIVWKTKRTFLLSETLIFFLKQEYILFSEKYFFQFLKNLITWAFFFAEEDTKKQRHTWAKASNATLVKLTDWIIKNDHVINFVIFFCRWFKHRQTSNVIWLFTTWLLIFQLELGNKKPLFTTKPGSIWTETSC